MMWNEYIIRMSGWLKLAKECILDKTLDVQRIAAAKAAHHDVKRIHIMMSGWLKFTKECILDKTLDVQSISRGLRTAVTGA